MINKQSHLKLCWERETTIFMLGKECAGIVVSMHKVE